MELRTADDYKNLFDEMGVEYKVNNSADVESYISYYKFDFKTIDFDGLYLTFEDNTLFRKWALGAILLFNTKKEYIGYCRFSTRKFIKEIKPTFY